MNTKNPTIAVLGSGPSGCYAAQFLRKHWPGAEITILESLPVPYGLLRYGVATDHQGTKAIAAQFDRLFEREGVRFAGNVQVGKDVAFATVAENFDIVIRATGLRHDRALPLPSHGKAKILGAGALLKALNGYPVLDLPQTQSGNLASLGKRVAIIGNGNVAMDVVRLLAKPLDDMDGSDVDDERLTALRADGVESIHVVGRSSAELAKFDLSMLKEIIGLSKVSIGVSGISHADSGKIVETLIEAASRPSVPGHVKVMFHFGFAPISSTSSDGCTILKLSNSADCGDSPALSVDSIITATGFTNTSPCGRPCSETEWIGKNVFKVGWLNRDGKGAIAENRKDAKSVTDLIIEMFNAGRLSASKDGFDAIHPLLHEAVVDFAGWKRIDEHERSLASGDRCRKKITDIDQMLSIARGKGYSNTLNKNHSKNPALQLQP